LRGRRERGSKEKEGEEGEREVVKKWMERNEGGEVLRRGLRERRERGSE
jgi:hypothetical protein